MEVSDKSAHPEQLLHNGFCFKCQSTFKWSLCPCFCAEKIIVKYQPPHSHKLRSATTFLPLSKNQDAWKRWHSPQNHVPTTLYLHLLANKIQLCKRCLSAKVRLPSILASSTLSCNCHLSWSNRYLCTCEQAAVCAVESKQPWKVKIHTDSQGSPTKKCIEM